MADFPALYGEGVSTAYADTFYQLAEEVAGIVDDPSLTPDFFMRLMNRGLGEIVAKLATYNVYLPSLAVQGESTARDDSDSVTMPPNYHGNLESVFDATVGCYLKVVPWDTMRRLRESGLPGRLRCVSVSGGLLHYYGRPDNDHLLRFSYHRLPSPLGRQDRVVAIPPELTPAILINYAAMRGFERVEQDPGDGKVQTKYHAALFNDALLTVVQEVGPWPAQPIEPSDYMGWGERW